MIMVTIDAASGGGNGRRAMDSLPLNRCARIHDYGYYLSHTLHVTLTTGARAF